MAGGSYQNSGMARFGATQGAYTPPTYTPMTFTPRTFTSGTTANAPRNTTAPGRVGAQPVQSSGSSSSSGGSSPYSFPTGGSSSLGNGQTIYYGDGTSRGISPGMARGIGLLAGMATGSPIAGGVLGQVMTGAGASTAGNLNDRQPYSDARDGGSYTGSSSSGSGSVPSYYTDGSYTGYGAGYTAGSNKPTYATDQNGNYTNAGRPTDQNGNYTDAGPGSSGNGSSSGGGK